MQLDPPLICLPLWTKTFSTPCTTPYSNGFKVKGDVVPSPYGGVFCLHVPLIPLGRRGPGPHRVHPPQPLTVGCWAGREAGRREERPSGGRCKKASGTCSSLDHQVASLAGQGTGGIPKEQAAVSPTKGTYFLEALSWEHEGAAGQPSHLGSLAMSR